jgi:hypothetical protein
MPKLMYEYPSHANVIDFETGQWEDLRFPAQGINPAGSAAPPTVDDTTVPGTLLFRGTTGNHVIAGVAQMPHAWQQGSSIHPHIHWTKTVADATNKYPVKWQFKYAIVKMGAVIGAYSDWQDCGDPVLGDLATAEKHNLSMFPMIDMTGVTFSDMLLWQLQRDISDDYAENVRLLELDFHYQIDSIGTLTEGIKE